MRYLTDHRAGLRIGTPGGPSTIAVDAAEPVAVHRAAANLAHDLARVCGAVPRLVADPSTADIIVGTIGCGEAVDRAAARGDLDVSGLRAVDGALHWEGYVLQTIGDRLYIAGADRRGTVFGIYDLCAAMGVSPWWWFADVPVPHRPHVTVRRGVLACDRPSVRYRGIFLNDEEQLDAWAAAHTPDGGIGPQTYERVFELLWLSTGDAHPPVDAAWSGPDDQAASG